MKTLLRVAALLAFGLQAYAGGYVGDYEPGDTVYCKFGTVRPSTGASFTLGGTPAISAYKDNSTTQSTTGITLTADFDSVTGMNNVTVTTASDGTFYSAGSFISLQITTGTVDSVSVTGQEVCSFTIAKTSVLRPTTAGRRVDVSAGGEVGLDWANIGSPTTTQNLSGTSTKALEPTTAGRTLDVSTGGEAGLDWANIGSPTTAQTLSGTTVGTATTLTNAPSDSSGTTTLLSRIGTPTNLGGGASVAANLADIEAQTDDIGAAGAGLTAADDAVVTLIGTPAGASVSADIAAIEAQTDDIGAAGAGLTALASASSLSSLDSKIGTPSNLGGGASVAANLSDIEGQTDDIGAAGAGLTSVPWNASWDAEVQSEADDALKGLFLDRLFAADYDPASKPGTSTALLNELVESDAGVSRFTANALEQGPAGGGGGTSDWTTGEKEQIRNRLGIDGDSAAPTATPTLATAADLATVESQTDDIGVAGAGLTALASASSLSSLDSKIGTPSNLGGGASVAANLADIEAQTDDIGTAGAGLTAADDAVMTRLGTPAGASVSADIATVAAQTDDIGIAGAGLTAAGPSAASIRTAVGLGSANLDAQLSALGVDLDSVLSAVASVAVSVEAVPSEVGQLVIESNGGGFDLKCVLRALFAYNVGEATTTDNASTFKDPSGTVTLVTGTAPSPGNRTVTVTCP